MKKKQPNNPISEYNYSKHASSNDNKFDVESTLLLLSIENYKLLLCPCWPCKKYPCFPHYLVY